MAIHSIEGAVTKVAATVQGERTATDMLPRGLTAEEQAQRQAGVAAGEREELPEGVEELTEKQRDQELQAQQDLMKERRKEERCVIREIERREKLKSLREKIRKNESGIDPWALSDYWA